MIVAAASVLAAGGLVMEKLFFFLVYAAMLASVAFRAVIVGDETEEGVRGAGGQPAPARRH